MPWGKRAQSFNISQQWFIYSPYGNNSRMKHIHSPQNKLWVSILLMTWSPHVVNNRAKWSGSAAMPAIYYNIHRAADDVYLFYLFICLNACLLKKNHSWHAAKSQPLKSLAGWFPALRHNKWKLGWGSLNEDLDEQRMLLTHHFCTR